MGRSGGKNLRLQTKSITRAIVSNRDLDSSAVVASFSEEDLCTADRLLEEMEKIAGPLGLDRTLVASIPTDDPEEALAWVRGDRSLIQDPEEVSPDMTAAAKDLLASLQAEEKIALFCDYDVDGVTAGEILRDVFMQCGQEPLMEWASASYGFGLTPEFVQKAHDEGCKTLVTVDCGSASLEAINLAKELGMKVVITDHHDILDKDSNGADHHLNPGLYEPRTSEATGAQMAWHLGAAILREKEGEVPEAHYRENLFLAGLGCVADWGTHIAPENRPFLKAADAPAGVRMLAKSNWEDPTSLEKIWKTSALLNLAKRTPEVSGRDAARVIRAKTQEEFEEAKAVLDAAKKNDGKKKSALQKEASSAATKNGVVIHVTEMEGVSGSSGVVAPSLATKSNTPAFVFAPMKEVDGRKVYKFSGRQPDGPYDIADLGKDKELQGLLLSGGGHAKVFSGECYAEDIPLVQEIIECWAKSQVERKEASSGDSSKKAEEKKPSKKPATKVNERLVHPDRIRDLHAGARQMAPYHPKRDRYNPPALSVRGKIVGLEKEGFRTVATLETEEGEDIKVQIGSFWDSSKGGFQNYDVQTDKECEVVVRFQPGEKLLAVEDTNNL